MSKRFLDGSNNNNTNKSNSSGGSSGTSLKAAFYRALEFLGDDALDALAMNLEEKYGIDIENNNVKLDDLELAIGQLFGQSAYFIINSIRRELES